MGDWALNSGGGAGESAGAVTGSSRGTQIAAAGTAHTKGTWTQLIASTAFDAAGMYVGIQGSGATADSMIDIGIGAATEEVLVPNLLHSRGNQPNTASTYIPIHVPAGSRLTARSQSQVTSVTVNILLTLIPEGPMLSSGFGRCTAYGADTSTTRGTNIDSGGTAHTKGAAAQLTASTTNPISCFFLGIGAGTDYTRTACNGLMDIMVGSATEEVILPNIYMICESQADLPMPMFHGPFFIPIAQGERITARWQSSITTAGDRTFDVVLYGLD